MSANHPVHGGFGRSLKQQASQMMIVKSHALGVLQQPNIILPNRPELWSVQSDINASLKRARETASTLLNSYVLALDHTLAGVETFLRMEQNFARLLNQYPLSPQAMAELRQIVQYVSAYRSAAGSVAYGMGTVRQRLFSEASYFTDLARRVNGVVSGDQGLLRAIEQNIAGIDQQIDRANNSYATSGLAAIGGAFLFLVGAVASVLLGGAGAPLAIIGGTMFLGGTVGAVSASDSLSRLLEEKKRLLSDHSRLKAEVAVVAGVASTMGTLSTSAAEAAAATQLMINGWTILESSLKGLVANVEQGLQDNGALMDLFGALAQADIQTIIDDVAIIRRQLAGARDVVEPGQPLAGIVQREARRLAG